MNQVNKTMDQPEITFKEAIKTRAYWQLVFGLFACGFGMNLMGTHAVPMLMDHHFEATTASYSIGMIGLVAIFSTMFLASVADRFPKKNILFWVYLIRGLGILSLVFVVTNWQLYIVAISGGLVWAGSNAMTSAILSDLYGVRLLGILNGWAFLVHQIGGAISSFLGGWGYEAFGTHVFAFGLAAVISILASIVVYFLPERITFHSKRTNSQQTLKTGM